MGAHADCGRFSFPPAGRKDFIIHRAWIEASEVSHLTVCVCVCARAHSVAKCKNSPSHQLEGKDCIIHGAWIEASEVSHLTVCVCVCVCTRALSHKVVTDCLRLYRL